MRYRPNHLVFFIAGFIISAILFLGAFPANRERPCNKGKTVTSQKQPSSVDRVPPVLFEDIGDGFVRRETLGDAGAVVVEELKKEELIPKVYQVCPFADVPPPFPQDQRYKKLEHELAPRDSLYVGIISEQFVFYERCKAIMRTWARRADAACFSAHGTRNFQPLEDIPIITLHDFNGGKSIFALLKYMFENHLSKYDFFLITHDTSYIKIEWLLDLVLHVNPQQVVYMGAPLHGKTKNGTSVRYCFVKSGVILSRAALAKLGKVLDVCQRDADKNVLEKSGDQVLGECMLVHLNTQCTWSDEVTDLFFMDDMLLSLKGDNIYHAPRVKSSLSLYPITEVELMYRLHMFITELGLIDNMDHLRQTKRDYLKLRDAIPRRFLRHPDAKWPTLPNVKVTSLLDLPVWEYFNSTHICTLLHQHPIGLLSQAEKMATQRVMDLVLAELHQNYSLHFMKRYTVYEGFRHIDPSVGIEYAFIVGLTDMRSQKPVQIAVNAMFPLEFPAEVRIKPWQRPWGEVKIHMIVPINRNEFNFVEMFLRNFYEECIINGLPITLHFVMCLLEQKSIEFINSEVDKILHNFPSTQIYLHDRNNTDCAVSSSYRMVAYYLHVDELMIFMRVRMAFSRAFLSHAMLLTDRGNQVYVSVPYQKHDNEELSSRTVTQDGGFWSTEVFEILSIYVQDFDTVGHLHQIDSIEDIWYHLLKHTSLSVVRALDPSLVRTKA